LSTNTIIGTAESEGLWLCAFGRFLDGNLLGAFNEIFSGMFGVGLFQEQPY